MRRWWWFVGVTVALLVAVGTGIWIFRGDRGTDAVYANGGSIALNNNQQQEGLRMDAPNNANSNDSNGSSGTVLSGSGDQAAVSGGPAPTGQGQSLSVQPVAGGSGNSPTAQVSGSGEGAAKSAPGPAEFGQYEAYKNEQIAYSGDFVAGSGAEAVAGKWLTMQYRGWLTNGSQFDASYERGTPFNFQLGAHHVIAGWEQGINGMKVGGKRRLIVPPAVGYGVKGQGPIPPNAVLVFDVELLAVSDKQPQ